MTLSDSSHSRAYSYARFCASLAMLMGALVLIGWHFKVSTLKTFLPGLVAMNPLTAICLMVSAVGIFLLTRDDEKSARWVNLIGYALVIIGTLKLGGLLGWWHYMPDLWIYKNRVAEEIFNGRPNRIPPNTALNIIMQGGAFLLRNTGRERGTIACQFMLSVQGFTALVAVLGYSYGARGIHDFGAFSPMALPTGLAFLLLTVATLCAIPDRGIMKLLVNQGEAGRINQRLLLAGLFIPLILGWLCIFGQRLGWFTPIISIAVFCMSATVCFIALTLWQGARLIERQNERIQQENHLRESEERFKFLADSAFEGILISSNGVVLDANNQFCRMLGYSIDEVIGMRNADFAIPEMQEYINRAVFENNETIYRSTGLRKDGSTVEIEVSARPIRLHGQKARVTAVRDITQRRQIEKMKDEFVSVVSHELRTPLTSIHGALGLMANGVAGQLSEPAQAMVDVAARNTKRLLALINDLLDIQKIEAGEMTFHKVEVDLTALIETTLQSMHSYSQSFEVQFDFTPPQETLWVCADPDRLTQVMTNLLSNAAKFSPSLGCVKVELQKISDGNNPERAQVSISDEGPGIPIEFRDRIFQKFAQADSSSTRQAGGTGLGLSICQAVIDKLGGTIGFDTEKDKGTTFYFQLPLLEAKTGQNCHNPTPQPLNFK